MELFHQSESYCFCGCGTLLLAGRRFVSGHNLRMVVKSLEHKANIGRGMKEVWDSGKRKRAVQGEIRIRNGRKYRRVRSVKGCLYWKRIKLYEEVDDWRTLSSSYRCFLRKKGLPIPKLKNGVKHGYKQTTAHIAARREAQRRYLFDMHAFTHAEKERLRKTPEYRAWRMAVFCRDNFVCQACGANNGHGKTVYLEADHIKSFTTYPQHRFDIGNGRTLCRSCHRKVSAKQMKGNKNGTRKYQLVNKS